MVPMIYSSDPSLTSAQQQQQILVVANYADIRLTLSLKYLNSHL